MKKLFFLGLFSGVLFANSLDIYTNKVIIEKTSSELKFSVPFELNISDIEISSSCDISSAYFTNFRKIEDPSSIKKTELANRLQALKDSYEIIRNSKLDKISDIDKILSSNLSEQSNIASELSLFNNINSTAILIKDLVVNTPCKEASIKYPVYSVNLDSKNIILFKDNKIIIKQNATISNLDENISSARVRFFPYSADLTQVPAAFAPVYLQKDPPAQIPDAPATMMKMSTMAETNSQPRSKPIEQTLHTFNFWQIDKMDLSAKKDNLLVLNTQELNATMVNFIDGYGTNKAYLMLNFTPEYDVQAARSDYYFDDKFIQTNYVNKMLKGVENRVYFGINNFIEIKKEVFDIKTDESLFGGKETIKSSWSYEIKNNSTKDQVINFNERIPVSTHEDIKVLMLGDMGVEANKDGKVELNFTLAPNETKRFKFGFAVTKPKSN